MSEPENPSPSDDDAHLAEDYALGVLSGADHRRAARRFAEDPAFATQVAALQAMLAPLAAEVPPVAPPPRVWRRIEASIAAESAPAARIARPARRLWHSLAFWRGFAFGSMALAAASLAAFVAAPRLAGDDPALSVAKTRGNPAGIIAAFNPKARKLLIVPAAPSASQQWVPELWLILPTGAPRSLGVVDPEQPSEVLLPPDLAEAINRSPTLAISLEPPGGSPSGQPSGPVIAEGILHRL